jgi:6-phospho-beta-glucosidase
MKITILGGGGVRTPLVIHGLARASLGVEEVCLFDLDAGRAQAMASLGDEIVRRLDGKFRIRVEPRLEEAVAQAAFVLNSIRVGGMAARARDERIVIEHGMAGQETTGPGGAAMALRTLSVTLAQARIIERAAPGAWFINFSNPAGLMTQAITQNTGLRVIGICDTPSELFFRLAEEMGGPLPEFEFDYAGLNHLGWVRCVRRNGQDVTERILENPDLLRRIYPADLFDPELIASLRLIPTEYLFFYYSQQRAHRNQLRAGASRGEELQRLNADLFTQLARQSPSDALRTYRAYLLQRNASYLKLEAESESAFGAHPAEYDPFETATGYHRIALDAISGLLSDRPREVVLNVPNCGAIEDLEASDVVEVVCDVDRTGARPRSTGRLPEGVRGLVIGVKEYERTLIRAWLAGSAKLARIALMEYPVVGQWERAGEVLEALRAADPEGLGYLQ